MAGSLRLLAHCAVSALEMAARGQGGCPAGSVVASQMSHRV